MIRTPALVTKRKPIRIAIREFEKTLARARTKSKSNEKLHFLLVQQLPHRSQVAIPFLRWGFPCRFKRSTKSDLMVDGFLSSLAALDLLPLLSGFPPGLSFF